MPAPAVYLDECVDQRLAVTLRARGLTVRTPHEATMLGASDERQLEYAATQGLFLLTFNGRHFAALDVALREVGGRHAGIGILPGPRALEQQTVRAAMMLDWVGSFADEPRRLVRWGEVQQYLIAGLRLPGYSESEVQLALGRG